MATRDARDECHRIRRRGANRPASAREMPGTRDSSDASRNGPALSRNAMMARARAPPIPGRASSSSTPAALRSTWPTPVESGVSAGTPVNRRWGSHLAMAAGPIPGTRSSPAIPPNAPRLWRSATIRRAVAGPIPGSLASSSALARSTSIRSSGPSGVARSRIESRCARGLPSAAGSTRAGVGPASGGDAETTARTRWPVAAKAIEESEGAAFLGGHPEGWRGPLAGEGAIPLRSGSRQRRRCRRPRGSQRTACRAYHSPCARPGTCSGR